VDRDPLEADAAERVLVALEKYRTLFKAFVDSRLALSAYEEMNRCLDEIRRAKMEVFSEVATEAIGLVLAQSDVMSVLWNTQLSEIRGVPASLTDDDMNVHLAHAQAIDRFEDACRSIIRRRAGDHYFDRVPAALKGGWSGRGRVGWLMGLEPTTTGITILDSTN
jgi:hypothetical protein